MMIRAMDIPANCTSFRTKQLARHIARVYDAELARAGMKSTQYSLLTHVRKRGPISTGELAGLLGLDASTLTRNMQVVLANGWIKVTAGQDSRLRLVALTESGKKVQEQAHEHWLVAQKSMTNVLGEGLAQELHDVLDTCLIKLRAHQDSSSI
jgi:DNA-binding MarR family transcriptional regulator